jgi:hypothetical protein
MKQFTARNWFEASRPAESRRQRNARWRRDAYRYRTTRQAMWTPLELLWLERLETLLEESRLRGSRVAAAGYDATAGSPVAGVKAQARSKE